jgi:hypothetical protein
MRFKHAPNTGFVERLYPKAKMIKIAALNAWRRATRSPQLAPDRHKVNQGSASAQLDETYRILSALNRASKHITIKVKHSVQIDDAQYQVINVANANHRSILIENVAASEIYSPTPDSHIRDGLICAEQPSRCLAHIWNPSSSPPCSLRQSILAPTVQGYLARRTHTTYPWHPVPADGAP